ncbi:unnamed protein product [Gordionus sp. m RMFG-2023]
MINSKTSSNLDAPNDIGFPCNENSLLVRYLYAKALFRATKHTDLPWSARAITTEHTKKLYPFPLRNHILFMNGKFLLRGDPRRLGAFRLEISPRIFVNPTL